MSEEQTLPDGPETAAEGSPADAPGEQGDAAGDPTISEATDGAGFAATMLGDTLPSAVRDALAAHPDAGSDGVTLAGAVYAGSAHSGHGHGGHADAHDGEHFAHTLPMKMLLGVLGALVILTVLTVAVTSIDLGSQGNFIIAMIIATIKAALVMGYFMHLVWDSKFNVFAFLSSFLFVLLFLSMTLLDRGEYQSGIDDFEADQTTTK
jgi:cytochrome c oxidase subunit 4